ncbi:MAG: hypothetical protein K5898_14245 [Ruminococcus sp.]|uniref:hypothetical protein n=1 Tax=Ruminococcus sp. TaxID=41978 RepID=UPI0025CE4CFA|nr:hypothetical protein [Ruminococcus sp.]MCR4796301.1 hypothetical protein [Ruminococcus sp.]
MKRMIAGIIALTTVLCTLTGCGKDAADDVKDTSVETTAAQENTTEENESGESVEAGSYEETVEEFFKAYIANDREKTFLMQYPDGFEDFIKVLLRTFDGDMTEEEIIDSFQSDIYNDYDEDKKISFKGIVDSEPLSDEEMDEMKEGYATLKWIVDYIDQNGGPDKVDPNVFNEESKKQDFDDLADSVKLDEAYNLKFEIQNDETGETSEGSMIVFRVEGEKNWLITEFNIEENVNDSGTEAMEAAASSLSKAGNIALVEMDEESLLGAALDKAFIVSSDDSMNYNVPDDFDTDIFKKKMKNYFEKMSELEWITVIKGGVVFYAAVDRVEDQQNVGTYPVGKVIIDQNLDYTDLDNDNGEKSLKDIYDICVESIG